MWILHSFSFIILIDNVHFQRCWLTRIHRTHITKMDWLRKQNKGGRERWCLFKQGKELSLWGEKNIGAMLTDHRIILQPAGWGGRTSASCVFFKNTFWLFSMCQTNMGARVTKPPCSPQNIPILEDCIGFQLLSLKNYYKLRSFKWQKGQKADTDLLG